MRFEDEDDNLIDLRLESMVRRLVHSRRPARRSRCNRGLVEDLLKRARNEVRRRHLVVSKKRSAMARCVVVDVDDVRPGS